LAEFAHFSKTTTCTPDLLRMSPAFSWLLLIRVATLGSEDVVSDELRFHAIDTKPEQSARYVP
jgi:hypothetical protein